MPPGPNARFFSINLITSSWRRVCLTAWLLLVTAWCGHAGEVLPPVPEHYFNDYAGVVAPEVAQRLDRQLEDFERRTSEQIIVAVYPHLQTDSSIEDYTVRVAQSWHVGQKGKDNGAVLFVFVNEHKLYIQTGYGLEGALPDGLCHQIIAQEITPRFRAGDFSGGLSAGVTAMLAAAQGEYKGTGQTVHDRRFSGPRGEGQVWGLVVPIFFILILFSVIRGLRAGPMAYYGGGTRRYNRWDTGSGWTVGGGNWGGGGGGGGGFSGGGGSFGGGGAGGSW